jgi:hypothetical protein
MELIENQRRGGALFKCVIVELGRNMTANRREQQLQHYERVLVLYQRRPRLAFDAPRRRRRA